MININRIPIPAHMAEDVIEKIIEREHRHSLAHGNETRIHLERITEGLRGVFEQEEAGNENWKAGLRLLQKTV